MIGDDTGPSFFQLEPNGDIKLRSGVNLPVDKEIQYTVSASNIPRSMKTIVFNDTC